jgi:nucleoside-diphosphate-sugar epimerase
VTIASDGGPAVVTGGTGFVGSHLVRALVADGRTVHVLGRATTDRWRLTSVEEGIVHHDLDLADEHHRRAVARLLASIGPSEVYHLAAAPLIAGRASSVATSIAVNVLGTHAVIEGAVSAGSAIVSVGDAFEYTDLGRPLREVDAWSAHPQSAHGITRLAATRANTRVWRETGAAVSTVRLFSVHGPHDHPQRLVPRLLAAALTGASVSLSSPDVVRDWVQVGDAVELLRRAARLPARRHDDDERVFNGGSGVATTLRALVESIEDVLGTTIDARWGAFPLADHDRGHWVADQTRTASVLGWKANGTLADGLVRTIAAIAAG